MLGKSSILECLISFHRDWRVNWDYPTGSHLLMILYQCALTDAGKTWITDINVKSQEKVHLMMDPPRICIWGPPNNPIKYQSQLTPNQPGWSTRCAKYLLCGQQAQSCGADEPWTTGWSIPKHKRHHLFGIILGCCTEKANFCFQMPSFRVKKLKLTNRRKFSKVLLSMDISELF